MADSASLFDLNKFIHCPQAGGIELYALADGPARGARVACFNTGGGLRYRVLIDRGLDIDQAFLHQYSLAFLTANGVSAPTRALDHGLDWLQSFPGGLLTSCGPFNVGPPGKDGDEELGLHGPHSNSAATIESIIQPNLHAGRPEMSITGIIRYGAFYGPSVELRRTIRSTLGSNTIAFKDEFTNSGNQPVPHAWLLHINFGYPLLDEGSEVCYRSPKIEPTEAPESSARFKAGVDYKRMLAPQETHRGSNSAVGYLFPEPIDSQGNTTVALVNPKLSIGVAIHYNTRHFPRCANWQHFGPREYVTALEPMNGTVDGRAKDRQRGLLDRIDAGASKTYEYQLEAVTDSTQIARLRALNG